MLLCFPYPRYILGQSASFYISFPIFPLASSFFFSPLFPAKVKVWVPTKKKHARHKPTNTTRKAHFPAGYSFGPFRSLFLLAQSPLCFPTADSSGTKRKEKHRDSFTVTASGFPVPLSLSLSRFFASPPELFRCLLDRFLLSRFPCFPGFLHLKKTLL